MKGSLLRVVLVVAVLLFWEGIVRGFDVPAFILPPPSSVLMALWRGTMSNLYVTHLWVTLSETERAALGAFVKTLTRDAP